MPDGIDLRCSAIVVVLEMVGPGPGPRTLDIVFAATRPADTRRP